MVIVGLTNASDILICFNLSYMTTNRLSFVLLALLFCLEGIGLEKFTLSGYIKDASSGETLIGTTAYISSQSKGVTSNDYGFYSLSMENGTYKVEYAYLGYETQTREIVLDKNTTLDVSLGYESAEFQEIVAVPEAEDKNVTNVQMSVNITRYRDDKKCAHIIR